MTDVRLAFGGRPAEIGSLLNPANQPALLVSYVESHRKGFEKCEDRINYRDWVLDSGAFSVFMSSTGKTTIDLQEFIEYAKEAMVRFPKLTEIFALDVIQDHKASLRNAEKMWEAGVPAIPCYHMGEPIEALDYIAKTYPKIAVGGLTGIRGGQRKADWARKVLKRVWPKKVHGFGCGSEAVILRVPFHSVDASSWSTGPRIYGTWPSMKGQPRIPIRDFKSEVTLLEREVRYILEIERRAKVRWAKEMAELESL